MSLPDDMTPAQIRAEVASGYDKLRDLDRERERVVRRLRDIEALCRHEYAAGSHTCRICRHDSE